MPKTIPNELFTPTQSSEPNPSDPLTVIGSLTMQPEFASVLLAKFVEPFVHEVETCAQELTLPPLVVEPTEFLEGATIRASVERPRGSLWLAQFDDVALLVSCGPRATTVRLRSGCRESLERVAATLTERAPAPVDEGDQVSFDFWQVRSQPYTTTRHITAPTFEEIAANYPGEVGESLSGLMAHSPSADDGRIILWHGVPGTGKTTAIRAMAREWAGRARFQVVLDPDIIFSQSAHLMSVVMDDPRNDPSEWRVLVIEDADELLREDAKSRVGQALSRLLNLGDGILGQGMRVIVLITTNEPIRRLHPALLRPGRCLSDIEFRKFTAAECGEAEPLSLAEIMNGVRAPTETSGAGGVYL